MEKRFIKYNPKSLANLLTFYMLIIFGGLFVIVGIVLLAVKSPFDNFNPLTPAGILMLLFGGIFVGAAFYLNIAKVFIIDDKIISKKINSKYHVYHSIKVDIKNISEIKYSAPHSARIGKTLIDIKDLVLVDLNSVIYEISINSLSKTQVQDIIKQLIKINPNIVNNAK
jgi:hypothetical protein